MNKQSKSKGSGTTEYINPDWINPLAPVDKVAERALVACLLDSPKLLPDAWELLGSADVIVDEGYKALLNTLYSLYGEGKAIKLSNIIQRLNSSGDIKLLVERGIDLMNLPKEARLTDFAETSTYLRGLWVKRIAIDSASGILSAINSGESVDEIASKASDLHESISSGLTIGADRTMSDFVRESLMRLDATLNSPGKLTGVETGLRKLNKHFGGWQNVDVIMIAGRPGMGKTVAGVFHAYEAARAGVPVAFISLEMAASSLIDRMCSMVAGVPYSDIMKGHVNSDQINKIHVAAGQIEQLPIHWYDEPNRDINDLTYKILNWKRKYGIGMVVIDYVQLLSDRTIKSSNETEILTSVSKKVKLLQRRLGCPVIELAQLNREVENRPNKRGKQSDLRSTGQFEQDASLIAMLYREDYYAEEAARLQSEETGQLVKPTLNHKLEYGIVKYRNGYTGTIILHADVALNQIFDEAPEVSQFDTPEKPVGQSFPKTNLSGWGMPVEEPKF